MQADVDRFQAQLRQMKKETKDASVDTYGECDDFTKMRDRLREASEKNAALVLECTNLRMKSWQDEERVNLSRRAAEEALSDVKDLEGKLENSQRAYQAKDHLAMSLDLQLQELVGCCPWLWGLPTLLAQCVICNFVVPPRILIVCRNT